MERYGMQHFRFFPLILAVALVGGCDDDPKQSATSTLTDDPTASTATATPAGTLSTAQPTEQWRFDAGDGYVLVDADERQAVISNGPNYDLDGERGPVIALDAKTGDEQWRVDFDCAPFQPLLTDEVVLIPCNDGTVFALDRDDGAERWRYDSGQAPYRLLVGDGLVFLDDVDPEWHGMGDFRVAHFPDRGRVQAVDMATGEMRWEFESGQAHTYLTLDGDRLYVGTGDYRSGNNPGGSPPGRLLALDAPTGSEIWSTGDIYSVHHAPRVSGDRVVVSARRVMAFDQDGNQLWESHRFSNNPLTVIDGVVVGVEAYGGDALFGLDAVTGEQLWAASWCDCGFRATVVGDHLLASGPGVALLDVEGGLDPATDRPLWSLIPDQTWGMQAPAVSGEWLYVGSAGDGTLFAYR